MKKYLILIILLIATSCTTTHRTNSHHQSSIENAKDIFVVQYSWHSAIIVKKSDIPEELIPEKEDFKNAVFLEIGWGNKDFYQAKEFELSLATKALFWPGASTMYVYGFTGKPENEYTGSKTIKLQLPPDKFYNLVKKMDNSFDRKSMKRATLTLKGQYGGNFYDAVGYYGIFNTCNNWTARVLKSGGVNVANSVYSSTARSVISQTSEYGTILAPNDQ